MNLPNIASGGSRPPASVVAAIILFGAALPFAYMLLWIRNIRTDMDGFQFFRGIIRVRFIPYTCVRSVNVFSWQIRSKTYYKTMVRLDDGKSLNVGDLDAYASLKIQLEARCAIIWDGPGVKRLSIADQISADSDAEQLIPPGFLCDWTRRNGN